MRGYYRKAISTEIYLYVLSLAASALLTIGHQQKLLDAIVKKASAIVPGQAGSKDMGPVIDEASRQKIKTYIDQAEAGGAKILLDGRPWLKHASGFYIGPTVILHTNKADPALHDEIFGPVLSILEVASNEEAIAIENANPYGNAGE